MKKKRFIGILVAVALAACFIVPHFVTADEPFCSQRHTWNAKQWFRQAVEFFDNIDFTGADIDIDSSSDLDIACEVGFTNGLYVGDELVTENYSHASGTGALTWAISYGNTLYLSGTTGITVTLPAATSTMDGYRLTVKNVSGSAARTVTPDNNSYIESVAGTMNGTADGCIAYPGDYRTWELDYSATSSVWRLIDSHCFVRNEADKVGSAFTTAASWTHAMGNIVQCTNSSSAALTLPTITEYMSGMIMRFKRTSGTTIVTLTPVSGVDAIEASAGTLSGSSDTTLDAAGDVGVYMALHSSDVTGASSVWIMLSEDVS